MESQPQNPEFRINPENFHQCVCTFVASKLLRAQADLDPLQFCNTAWVKVQNFENPELSKLQP